jgi:hypothetical protein
MTIQRIFAATLSLAALTLPAAAHGLKPIQSQRIDLGQVAGDAYYTAEPDGFHLVATFAQRSGGTPLRFQALLSNGQSITVSTPHGDGEVPTSVKIIRQNDEVLVRPAELTD